MSYTGVNNKMMTYVLQQMERGLMVQNRTIIHGKTDPPSRWFSGQ